MQDQELRVKSKAQFTGRTAKLPDGEDLVKS
jgi:hypothetical protein